MLTTEPFGMPIGSLVCFTHQTQLIFL